MWYLACAIAVHNTQLLMQAPLAIENENKTVFSADENWISSSSENLMAAWSLAYVNDLEISIVVVIYACALSPAKYSVLHVHPSKHPSTLLLLLCSSRKGILLRCQALLGRGSGASSGKEEQANFKR